MPKKTQNKNKTSEEEEIEEEEKEEETKENQEEEEITTPKKKKKKKKAKKENTEEIEEEEKPKEEETKPEEIKNEEKPKKGKKKKRKKKKIEKEETEEKEVKEEENNNKENATENKEIIEDKNIQENNIENNIKEETNNIEEDNKEDKEDKEDNLNKEEDKKNNDIIEEKNMEEKQEQKEIKQEDIKEEANEEQNEEIKEKEKEKNTKNKKQKNKKAENKPKKSKKKSRKEIEEEENETEEKEEEEQEEIEEQETSPTERKKQKKTKEKKSKEKKPSKFHINAKFEKEINLAYKKLQNINKHSTDESEDEEEEEESDSDKAETKKESDMQYIERRLRNALNISKTDLEMIINRNIIDKLSRIVLHQKINIDYIIGNIFIVLMNKEYLFDYEDEENFDVSDLILFINKVIQFRSQIKETKIYISYDETLKQFLFFVTEQFELEDAQTKSINKILEEETGIDHSNLTTKKTFNQFINVLNSELENQPNIYEQYESFIQNKKEIIKLIQECDPENLSNHNDYLKLGKYLAYMFFNNTFNIFIQKNTESEDEEDFGEMLLFYNGRDNRGEINIVNGEKFCIGMDDKVKEMRKILGEIIIKYCEQFVDIIDVFQIQYIIFILLSRLYSCNFSKYKDELNPIFAESLINMCFFDNSPLKLISKFINQILSSDKEENDDLKKILLIKIKEVKSEEGFLYQMPEDIEKKYQGKAIKYQPKKTKQKKTKKKADEEEDEEDDLDNLDNNNKGDIYGDIISEENLFVLHNDLKLAFFDKKVIKSGEKYTFIEELEQEYSLLDFCLDLSDLDIKFTITDITEGRIIYSKERLVSPVETPLKIVMFFTNPRVLKFEFDNSYSWVRSKTINYKTNIFYPKYPYLFNHQIFLGKYINTISKTKKDITKKKNKGKKKTYIDNTDKILMVQINKKNRVYNCINIRDNLEAINQLIKGKYLSIISLYIKLKEEKNIEDKSCFYCYSKEKQELIENELTKENFDNVLNKITNNENVTLTLVNLYIINGNINDNNTNTPLRNLLGFEPSSDTSAKILFLIQSLTQAQLLYCLYKQIINEEFVDVLILINYTKSCGYQLNIFDTDEILDENENFKGLNESKDLEENIKIIIEGIKKFDFGEERKVLVVICPSLDEKESEVTPDKIEDKLKQSLGNEENGKNIGVIKAENEFNKEVGNYSHIFYLEN